MSALGGLTPGAAAPGATSEAQIDRAVSRLGEAAESFVRTSAAERSRLLAEIRRRIYELAPRLAAAGCEAKGIGLDQELYGEELLASPVAIIRYVRVLQESLQQIGEHGVPVIPSELVSERGDGSSVQVLPVSTLDRLRFATISGEAWLDLPVEQARSARALAYRGASRAPEVGLVLGAGNVASIPGIDALHELFVVGRTCLLKMSPVNDYLGPLFELAFAPLIHRGYLAIVYGGAEVGAYCCAHPGIAAIHITGSTETHDRIVWGDEPERSERKRRGEPLLKKKITSELGNITPVIVPPGDYSDRELDHLTRSIAGMLTHNASFNCLSAKMLVTPARTRLREELLARLGALLEGLPTRKAYYPGAPQRYARFVEGQRGAREFGSAAGDHLPWALVSGLTPESDTLHFHKEPFCSVLAEVALPESEPDAFLAAATRFANERLWGTLSAVLIAPGALLADPSLKLAHERAVEELEYGAVAVNGWSGLAFGIIELPWGAAPGATLEDVQSGIGWTHNAYMLEGTRKSVVRAPLAAVPAPFWYPGRRLRGFAQAFLEYEYQPGPLRLAKLVGSAL